MLAEKGVKWITNRNLALVTGIMVCRPERDEYGSRLCSQRSNREAVEAHSPGQAQHRPGWQVGNEREPCMGTIGGFH